MFTPIKTGDPRIDKNLQAIANDINSKEATLLDVVKKVNDLQRAINTLSNNL